MAVIKRFLVMFVISMLPSLINAACKDTKHTVLEPKTCSLRGGEATLNTFDGEVAAVKTDCTVKLADFTCRGYAINAISEMMYVNKLFTVSNFFITITNSTGYSWSAFMDATYIEDYINNKIDPHVDLLAPTFVTIVLGKTPSGELSFALTLKDSDFRLNFTKTSNDASPGSIVISCGDVTNAKAYPDNLCGGTNSQGIRERTANSHFTSVESAIFYDSLYREITDPNFIQLSTRCTASLKILRACDNSKRRPAHDKCGQLWVNDDTRNSSPMSMDRYSSCLSTMCQRDVPAS